METAVSLLALLTLPVEDFIAIDHLYVILLHYNYCESLKYHTYATQFMARRQTSERSDITSLRITNILVLNQQAYRFINKIPETISLTTWQLDT